MFFMLSELLGWIYNDSDEFNMTVEAVTIITSVPAQGTCICMIHYSSIYVCNADQLL